jgi:hypothetical protein
MPKTKRASAHALSIRPQTGGAMAQFG